jgi:hypothetical protein
MTTVFIRNETLNDAVSHGRPVWCVDRSGIFKNIVCYCPNGHLNQFPPMYGVCLCGFDFKELKSKYHLRYKDV